MESLKKPKIKHDHKLTDYLKFGIFAIMMILPFLNIGSKCLYVICNKNAYKSYYGATINEEQQITQQYTELIPNKEYTLSNELLTGAYTPTSQTRLNLVVNSIEGVSYTEQQISQMASLAFYVNSSNIPRLYFYDSNNNSIGGVIDLDTKNVIINFIFKSWTNPQNNLTLINDVDFYYINYNKYSYLDNVFQYSINQVETEPLFSWTKQTGTYNVFQTVLTTLDMPNTFLSILFTYWMMITLIYIIIDIIIKIFTYITHFLNN